MVELTADTFYPFVQGHSVAFVHFWAGWNGSDYGMKQTIRALEQQYGDTIAFGSLDIDPEPHHAICVEHGVMGPPFYAYYRGGQRVATEVGVLSKAGLKGRLDWLLRSGSPIIRKG